MSQPSMSPPPYAAEYDKPPAYFNPVGGNSATNPSTSPAPVEPGWQHSPQPPPPPYYSRNENEQQQQAGVRGPTIIAVTTTPAYITSQPHQQQTVLVLGNCPSCRIGFLRNEFNICGILMAFIFFPVGILCCLCMMDKRCSHCGARF